MLDLPTPRIPISARFTFCTVAPRPRWHCNDRVVGVGSGRAGDNKNEVMLNISSQVPKHRPKGYRANG